MRFLLWMVAKTAPPLPTVPCLPRRPLLDTNGTAKSSPFILSGLWGGRLSRSDRPATVWPCGGYTTVKVNWRVLEHILGRSRHSPPRCLRYRC